MPQGIRYKPAEDLQQVKDQTSSDPGIMRTVMDLLGFSDMAQLPQPSAMVSRLPAVVSKISPAAVVRDFPRAGQKQAAAQEVHKSISEWLDFSQKMGKLSPQERLALGEYFSKFGDEAGYMGRSGPINYDPSMDAGGVFDAPEMMGPVQSKIGAKIRVNPYVGNHANVLAHEGEHFKQFLQNPMAFAKGGVYRQLREAGHYMDVPEEIGAREGAKAAGFKESLDQTTQNKLMEIVERLKSGHYADVALNAVSRQPASTGIQLRDEIKRKQRQ